ncbi:GNAT family N-acetyltransferase [Agromyces binzhouensis]|uniref:GNAT family N-acetyltransferase n=1 Tax=Agromyces binzhouensis TaxID=1817495 RepID=UPI0036367867
MSTILHALPDEAADAGPPSLRLPFDVAEVEHRPFTTARMTLRPLAAYDADDVWEYQRLPEVLRYIPWPERERDEAREHTEARAGMRRLVADGDAIFLAMVLDGRVIGDLMVRLSSAQHARLEIGWVVHPDFHGRGLATEGADVLLDLAFGRLAAHRVVAHLDARNAASAGLCERLGMRREATIVEEEYNDGEWQDTASYGMLRREWRALRAGVVTRNPA